MTMNNETAEKIAKAIDEKKADGVTRSSVALKAGIARNTFMRKLNGGAEFGVYEVARVAMALHMDPAELLPSVYHQAQKDVA